MKPKGRPRDAMTTRRKQVLDVITESRDRLSWAEIARRCGIHDYNNARRTVRDLERMGRI